MKPLISILIPAYNAQDWIAETIQSAIAQSWPRKEIIVVDDGSRDATVEVARRFASNAIKVVSKENQGAAATRNYALGLAQGDYIQWLDADDLLAPKKIELQIDAVRESDNKLMLLSGPWGYFNYRPQQARFVATSLWQDLAPVDWLVAKMSENLHMQTATWLTSRELTDAAGPWNTQMLSDDDGEYFSRVLLKSSGTRFVAGAKVYYRITQSNRLSHIGTSDRKKDAMVGSMKLHVQYLRALEDSERVRKACLSYLQNWYHNFYPERPDLVAELQSLAAELHGRLEEPRLRWKYAWIKPLFGWKAAKSAQIALPQFKAAWIRKLDKALYRLQTLRASANPDSMRDKSSTQSNSTLSLPSSEKISVSVFSGCADKPYAFGLTMALIGQGATLDLIGGDELNCPEFRQHSGVNFLNLRGDQSPDAGFATKAFRVLRYYGKLIRYAASAKPKIFHILWNNKFDHFDRTLLMIYYRILRKKSLLTVHNVNAGKRDLNDSWLNRLTLKIQYRLADHLFVHTEQMLRELSAEFDVLSTDITVIPFGINNAVPNTSVTPASARNRLGIDGDRKTILFFGNINPYKGLEHLTNAFALISQKRNDSCLVIAGRPNNCDAYWNPIREALQSRFENGDVLLRSEFIPDEEVELYFKAADVLVLPYRHIYQSGVLFLAHSFGLPVLAADVGSLRDDIVEGETGFLFRPEDPADLAKAIERYFESDLYSNLNQRRPQIQAYVAERHSWEVVGQKTMAIYADLLRAGSGREPLVSNSTHSAPGARAHKKVQYRDRAVH